MVYFLSFKIRALQVFGIRKDRDGCFTPLLAPGAFLFLGGVNHENRRCQMGGQ